MSIVAQSPIQPKKQDDKKTSCGRGWRQWGKRKFEKKLGVGGRGVGNAGSLGMYLCIYLCMCVCRYVFIYVFKCVEVYTFAVCVGLSMYFIYLYVYVFVHVCVLYI